jgi:hypothetical protein
MFHTDVLRLLHFLSSSCQLGLSVHRCRKATHDCSLPTLQPGCRSGRRQEMQAFGGLLTTLPLTVKKQCGVVQCKRHVCTPCTRSLFPPLNVLASCKTPSSRLLQLHRKQLLDGRRTHRRTPALAHCLVCSSHAGTHMLKGSSVEACLALEGQAESLQCQPADILSAMCSPRVTATKHNGVA